MTPDLPALQTFATHFDKPALHPEFQRHPGRRMTRLLDFISDADAALRKYGGIAGSPIFDLAKRIDPSIEAAVYVGEHLRYHAVAKLELIGEVWRVCRAEYRRVCTGLAAEVAAAK